MKDMWMNRALVVFLVVHVRATGHSAVSEAVDSDDSVVLSATDTARVRGERRAADDTIRPLSPSVSATGSSRSQAHVTILTAAATTSARSPATTATTMTSDQCVDKIINCLDYKQESCVEYRTFMADNCPHFCGFCSGSGPVCRDRLFSCARYGKETCLAYANFRDIHCRAYCDNCDASTVANA